MAEPTLEEIARRRTFAIISHPDAGKTTLTEKVLLYGGAIQVAGEVKARKNKKSATSDWMAMEKERGISVATSVMQIDFEGHRINLLDTPGHNDFSEDTYRTLAAADCAVMLVDHAKGVEPQTIKLFDVCRLRGIPIVTFVNKLDRPGLAPLDILDEIENVLQIPTCPMTWPIGQGNYFQGVYDRENENFIRFDKSEVQGKKAEAHHLPMDSDKLQGELGDEATEELRESMELLDAAGNPFSQEDFLAGKLSPVFFGSAMNNFGIEPFLQRFLSLCPSPRPRKTQEGVLEATHSEFTGFVFKIQANMDPRHRDRVAFVRICSGKFERGMKAQLVRTGRQLNLDRAMTFFASDRKTVEEAYGGDIIGLWDSGMLRLGDTLWEGKKGQPFEGIPYFSPEFFVRARLNDPMKRKQMKKGIEQLCEEGAVQLFRDRHDEVVDPILGAVGWLQLEVVQYRLKHEYSVDVQWERLPYSEARWVFADDFDPKKVITRGSVECVYDVEGRPLLLFESRWTRQRIEQNNEDWEFVAAVQPGRSKKSAG